MCGPSGPVSKPLGAQEDRPGATWSGSVVHCDGESGGSVWTKQPLSGWCLGGGAGMSALLPAPSLCSCLQVEAASVTSALDSAMNEYEAGASTRHLETLCRLGEWQAQAQDLFSWSCTGALVLSVVDVRVSGQVLAICDPPRGGLHNNFLAWLRRATQIKRLVYVSCDQSSLIRDTMPLTKPCSSKYSGACVYVCVCVSFLPQLSGFPFPSSGTTTIPCTTYARSH